MVKQFIKSRRSLIGGKNVSTGNFGRNLGWDSRVDKLVLQTHIHRPIVTGLIVGLILGDVNTGLITGATLELVWIGAVAIGGAQPPNVVMGSYWNSVSNYHKI